MEGNQITKYNPQGQLLKTSTAYTVSAYNTVYQYTKPDIEPFQKKKHTKKVLNYKKGNFVESRRAILHTRLYTAFQFVGNNKDELQ